MIYILFDKGDIIKFPEYKLKDATNFWISNDCNIRKKLDLDIFYLGVGISESIAILENLHGFCEENNLNFKSLVTVPFYNSNYENTKIEFMTNAISYVENLNFVQKSAAILDIKLHHHNGLSFRFFEAMYYNKKMITNNASVVNYDFYDPNNIFITDFEDFSGLNEFMKLPYQIVASEIKEKYGFSNWIKYVLNIEPHQEIHLPECR